MNKSVLNFLFKRKDLIKIKKYNSTRMDEIEKGKKAAAYKAIDDNVNEVETCNYCFLVLQIKIFLLFLVY